MSVNILELHFSSVYNDVVEVYIAYCSCGVVVVEDTFLQLRLVAGEGYIAERNIPDAATRATVVLA